VSILPSRASTRARIGARRGSLTKVGGHRAPIRVATGNLGGLWRNHRQGVQTSGGEKAERGPTRSWRCGGPRLGKAFRAGRAQFEHVRSTV
jgi:hypothetical protein